MVLVPATWRCRRHGWTDARIGPAWVRRGACEGRLLTRPPARPVARASSTVTMGYDDSGDSPAFATTVSGG